MQKAKKKKSSIQSTRPYKGIPGIPAARPSKGNPVIHDIPDIPVIHDIQPSRHYSKFQHFQYIPAPSSTSVHSSAIQYLPVHPGIPPHFSIPQLECIFYTSTGSTRNFIEYQLNPSGTLLQTFLLQRKGDVAIRVRMTLSAK